MATINEPWDPLPPDLWHWKLEALLYPKAWTRSGINGLQELADNLCKNLCIETPEADVKLLELADRLAGATHRFRLIPRNDVSSGDLPACFIHPLSGQRYALNREAVKWLPPSWDFPEGCSGKEKFWYIWRYLTRDLNSAREILQHPGYGFEFIPADAIAPHFPLRNHLDVTAAVYTCLKSDGVPGFLSFNFGSPQRFLEAGRKLVDLWAASFLLSFLTMQIIKELALRIGPDMFIYPDLRHQVWLDFYVGQHIPTLAPPEDEQRKLIPTFPNQFLVMLPANNVAPEKLRAFFQEILQRNWQNMATAAREYVERKVGREFKETQWRQQLAELPPFEFIYYPWGGEFAKAADHNWKVWAGKALAEEQRLHEELFGSTSPLTDYLQKAQDWPQAPERMVVGDAYALIFRKATAFLSARRTERLFVQLPLDNSSLPKDSLSGELEQLSPATGEHREFWRTLSRKVGSELNPNEGLSLPSLIKRFFRQYIKEELALSAEQSLAFPSLASVATAQYRRQLLQLAAKDNTIQEKLKEYIMSLEQTLADYETLSANVADIRLPLLARSLRDSGLDGESEFIKFCTIEGDYLSRAGLRRLGQELIKHSVQEPQEIEERIKACEDKLTKLRDAIKAALEHFSPDQFPLLKSAPPVYYAVVRMDGDQMGEWLSGRKHLQEEALHLQNMFALPPSSEKLKGMPTPLNLSIHQTVSSALQNFAQTAVYQIVEEHHGGKVVYAGGDDLLAVLPASEALACARKLRAAYSGFWHPETGEAGLDKLPEIDWSWPQGMTSSPLPPALSMGYLASSSAGIVLAHIRSALSTVLASAQEAEKNAKDNLGRNAWMLILQKRSGETVQVGLPWYLPNSNIDTVRLLLLLVAEAEKPGGLSMAFFYEAAAICQKLQDMHQHLLRDPLGTPDGWNLQAIISADLNRLWERHHEARQPLNKQNPTLDSLLKELLKYLARCQELWEEYCRDLTRHPRTAPPQQPHLTLGGTLSNLWQAAASLARGGRE